MNFKYAMDGTVHFLKKHWENNVMMLYDLISCQQTENK